MLTISLHCSPAPSAWFLPSSPFWQFVLLISRGGELQQQLRDMVQGCDIELEAFIRCFNAIIQIFVEEKSVLERIAPFTDLDARKNSSAQFPPPSCRPKTLSAIKDCPFPESPMECTRLEISARVVTLDGLDECGEDPNGRRHSNGVQRELAVRAPHCKSLVTIQLANDPDLIYPRVFLYYEPYPLLERARGHPRLPWMSNEKVSNCIAAVTENMIYPYKSKPLHGDLTWEIFLVANDLEKPIRRHVNNTKSTPSNIWQYNLQIITFNPNHCNTSPAMPISGASARISWQWRPKRKRPENTSETPSQGPWWRFCPTNTQHYYHANTTSTAQQQTRRTQSQRSKSTRYVTDSLEGDWSF